MGCLNFYTSLFRHVLHGLHFICAYVDEVLIACLSLEEHINHMQLVFDHFKKFGVVIDPIECEFGNSEINFLGHNMNFTRISPSPSKVKAIKNFPMPDMMRKLRQILGMINFFRRFLPKCGQVVKPSTDILINVKNCDIVLSASALTAF